MGEDGRTRCTRGCIAYGVIDRVSQRRGFIDEGWFLDARSEYRMRYRISPVRYFEYNSGTTPKVTTFRLFLATALVLTVQCGSLILQGPITVRSAAARHKPDTLYKHQVTDCTTRVYSGSESQIVRSCRPDDSSIAHWWGDTLNVT